MRVRLLTLHFENALGTFDDRPLDQLLAGRELLDLREHFFLNGGVPHLLCVVQFRQATAQGSSLPRPNSGARSAEPIPRTKESGGTSPSSGGRSSKPDPMAGLDEVQRMAFQTLREWRSDTARAEGVPPYVVLTNRELAAIIQLAPRSRAALAEVPGIGKGKLERYGEELLARVADILVEPSSKSATECVSGEELAHGSTEGCET